MDHARRRPTEAMVGVIEAKEPKPKKRMAMNRRSPAISFMNVAFVAVAIAVFGTACDRDSPTSPGEYEIETEPTVDAEAGKEVFERLCITCHGPGAPPEENLTGVTQRIDYAEFDQIMDEGKGTMPAWKSVNEHQRRNIWEFLDTYEIE